MQKGFLKIKNYTSKNLIIINGIFSLISIVVVCQNPAFLFNPFILVLLCGAYVVSFSTFCCSSIFLILIGFIIDKIYGFELLFLVIVFVLFYFLSKCFSNEKIRIYLPMIMANISIFLIYFITSKDVFYRINSLVLVFISVIFSINIIDLICKYKSQEEVNTISLALLIGLLTSVFYYIETFNYLWTAFILLLVARVQRKELYFISCFISFLLLYLFSNNSFNILLALYFSYSLVGLINFKFNYFFFIPIISLFLLSVNSEFYLDPIYYQVITGFLLMCLMPNNFLNYLRAKINYIPKDSLREVVEYQNNKFNEISNLCNLLMDDRFDKYDSIDTQLEKAIKKEVCSKCSNEQECKLSINKYLTGYLSNTEKSEINEGCLYPYQVTKSINSVNKRIIDYSERELKSVESKKIMNNAYQIIKKYIDLKPKLEKKKEKFSITMEELSFEANNSPNGDAYRLYQDEYHTILALSDGMGHTTKSRDISQYLIELINYLILISDNIETAIESCNQILLAKTYEEVYATLDLCNFDLEKGKIEIYKAGSFPTYLIRNKSVKEITSKLPPIGIINGVQIKPEIFDIRNNDILLFFTDGFGEDIAENLQKTVQKSSFLPLKNYVKFLYNSLGKDLKGVDDQTIIAIKVNKI